MKRVEVRERNTFAGIAIAGLGAKVLGASNEQAVLAAFLGGLIGNDLEPDPQRR